MDFTVLAIIALSFASTFISSLISFVQGGPKFWATWDVKNSGVGRNLKFEI